MLLCVNDVHTTRRVLGKDYIIKWTWLKTLKCIDCKVFPLLCWKIKFSEYVANRQQITWFKALKCKISENAVVFFWRVFYAPCLLKCACLSLQFVEVWSRMESVRMRRVWVVDAGLKPSGSYVRWTPHRPSTSELWWSVTLLI